MKTYNEALQSAGLTDEQLKQAVLDRFERENIKLSEFSEEQKKKIIIMYAATELRDRIN